MSCGRRAHLDADETAKVVRGHLSHRYQALRLRQREVHLVAPPQLGREVGAHSVVVVAGGSVVLIWLLAVDVCVLLLLVQSLHVHVLQAERTVASEIWQAASLARYRALGIVLPLTAACDTRGDVWAHTLVSKTSNTSFLMLVDSVGSGMRLSADSAMSLARRCASVKHRLAKSFQSCSSQYCTSGTIVSTCNSVLAQDGEHVFVAAASGMEIASHQKHAAAWHTRQQSARSRKFTYIWPQHLAQGVPTGKHPHPQRLCEVAHRAQVSYVNAQRPVLPVGDVLLHSGYVVNVRGFCRAYVSGGRQRITVQCAGAAQATCHGVHATRRRTEQPMIKGTGLPRTSISMYLNVDLSSKKLVRKAVHRSADCCAWSGSGPALAIRAKEAYQHACNQIDEITFIEFVVWEARRHVRCFLGVCH